MTPKTKIAIAVAGVLGVAALGLIVLSHRGQAAAAAQDDSSMGGFPNLLFSPSSGPAQIATSGSTQTDATTGITGAPDSAASSVMAALAAAQSQITASNSVAYNTNATELFKQLPGTLASVGLNDFMGSISQDAAGKTTLEAHNVYTPPPPPPPAPVDNRPTARVDATNRQLFDVQTGDYLGRYGYGDPEKYTTARDWADRNNFKLAV